MTPTTARAVCARGLAQLLAFGEVLDGADPERSGEWCAGDPEALSVLAALGHRPAEGAPDPDAVARRTLAACELVARWQEVLAERNVRCLPLGGVAHLGRLYRQPGERLVERAQLLVSPFDAARARVALASGGLERIGSPGTGGVTFRAGETTLELRWALHPPGWSSLPTSPFFEGSVPGTPPCPATVMAPGASWAAHRLLLASTLWRPGAWRPLDLAEAAVLGLRVDEAERRRWGELVGRWGAGRLWRRAQELDRWLLGGGRPVWLAEKLADRGGRHRATPGLVEGLRLQDTPARALLYLGRRILLHLR